MEPDVLAELLEPAERYYDSTFDLNEAEKVMRAIDVTATVSPHAICDAQCRLHSQKGETLRAAGALLRAVENYRAFHQKTPNTQLDTTKAQVERLAKFGDETP